MERSLTRVVVRSKGSPAYGRKGEVIEDNGMVVTVLLDNEEGPANTFLFQRGDVRPLVPKRRPDIGNIVRISGYSRQGEDVDGAVGEVEAIDRGVVFVRANGAGYHLKASQLRVLAE